MKGSTYWKSFGVYVVLTMVCAAGWHLGLFPGVYAAANMRPKPLMHLGMLSILIQAAIVSYLYPRVRGNGSPPREGAWFGLLMGLYMGSYGVLAEAGSRATLEVDGGIARDTIGSCWRAGADTFVAGNAIFSAKDPQSEIGALRDQCAVSV